jgi:hypothetical protein
MRRRELFASSGVAGIAALAATRAFAQTQTDDHVRAVNTVSKKALLKESGSKGAYAVPKNANKQARYLASLTGLLTLSMGQQQQAVTIFTNAVSNRTGITATIKSVRKVLATAVLNNDSAGIAQAASQIGALTTQYITNGATAHASFYQLLTPTQQTTLSQYQGLANGIVAA